MSAIAERVPELIDQRLVKVSEAAEILSIGKTKIYELLAQGRLKRVRIDNAVRIPFDSLKEFLAEVRGE
ncbi:MAG: helix-turn-helix domain-containing protein [Planctomycetaceae bacterium]